MLSMKMSEGGRVVVPAEIRRAMQISDGDTGLWELVDGTARMTTQRERIRQLQLYVRQFVPAGVSLVDELTEERRTQAARE